MQDPIPYRNRVHSSSAAAANSDDSGPKPPQIEAALQKLVAENAVVVFGRQGCCMCHVVKRLLLGLGVNPPVVEVDEHAEAAVIDELARIAGGVEDGEGGGQGDGVKFPAVFVGGKLFGGLERVVATHISGELVPVLKEAGALWL
ncbi:Glutaredoxin-C9 [Sarracenia purpurea var. burkii]